MSEQENKQTPPPPDDGSQQNEQLDSGSTVQPTSSPAEAGAEADTQPETSNPRPETEQEMEVHHHTHHEHGKRNWKSYFNEFFMLFLAVFCGFLAEYQLEHVIENQREKKYVASLLEDLTNDTADLRRDISNWQRIQRKTDSLRNEILKSTAERDHRMVYRLAGDMKYNNTFLYHDRTIGQLKHSGNFRLLRNKMVADTLVEYDAWIQTTLNGIEEIYSNIISPAGNTLDNQLFHSKFYEIRNDPMRFDSAINKEPGIILIRQGKDDILFQYYNHLQVYKSHAAARLHFLNLLRQKATHIIELIRSGYHLE